MSFLEELESLRIPFRDIKKATKNFITVIGKGGYGFVCKGELLLSGKLTTVAVKRLDGHVSGQGFKEFLTEIQLLTRYKHPNLISLIGFCDQYNEKILIYEHADHGSLDKYLSTAENRSKLTWKRRINICVNAARGLNHLHNQVAANERVIHRDIKSANVLLDRNWKAMISDFGLSKLGRANEKDTFLITNASGTHGYCDPVYISSGILTKESDVYSFGVVLFEILCGRLCIINVDSEHRFLPSLAQRYCKIGKIDEIMDPALKNQIDSDSLHKFSKIASQCLQNNRKRRPSMRTVLKKLEELENALELQLRSEQQESFMQGTQPFHMMSPQHQQQSLLAQQNMTSQSSNDESRLRRMFLNSRIMRMGKDGLSSSVGDIPNVGSPMGVLPDEDDMLVNKQHQLELERQQQRLYQQQLWEQQQQQIGSVGDGSMSISFSGNDQAARKRKQPVSSSRPSGQGSWPNKSVMPEISPSSQQVTGSSDVDASMSTSPPPRSKPRGYKDLANLTVTGMKKELKSIQQNIPTQT